MQSSKDLLVITSSNGENLNLANRFAQIGASLNIKSEILDLTTIDLPLYNPRTNAKEGVPQKAIDLSHQMAGAHRWVICAPEYNGSIPPLFTNVMAWLSIQNDDFRTLVNGRPIAIASISGGGGMELLISLRIQLTHLGAQVVGRQLMGNSTKIISDEAIKDVLSRLLQMKPLQPSPSHNTIGIPSPHSST